MSGADLGPLDWRIAITDRAGRPTPEFQRRWAIQRSNNDLIGVNLGAGPPTSIPIEDGEQYADDSTTPFTYYVSHGGEWKQTSASKFTDLLDVPHNYTSGANKLVQVNSGATGLQFTTLTAVIDGLGSPAQGDVLYRNATSWVFLAPGTSGQVLSTGGASANPSWITPVAGVTSVALSAPSIFTVSGSPVTTTGTLTFTLNTESANLIFSGPSSGSAATPTFRALAPSDWVTIGTTTSGSTITPSSAVSQYEVTALAAAATIAAPSGTPIDGQKLIIRIKDNGTARALTWTTTSGAYRAVGTTLPTTTVLSKVVYLGCIYNGQDTFWDVVAVAQL